MTFENKKRKVFDVETKKKRKTVRINNIAFAHAKTNNNTAAPSLHTGTS
jgi:hypothetical protein